MIKVLQSWGLIWVLTVRKGYQQTTKVTTSKGRVKLKQIFCVDHNLKRKFVDLGFLIILMQILPCWEGT